MEFSELNSRNSRAEAEVRQQMEKLESQLSPSAKQILETYRKVRIVLLNSFRFFRKNSIKFVYYNEELVTNSKFLAQLSRKLQRFRTS